jgi:hypothetical protein
LNSSVLKAIITLLNVISSAGRRSPDLYFSPFGHLERNKFRVFVVGEAGKRRVFLGDRYTSVNAQVAWFCYRFVHAPEARRFWCE